MFDINKFDRIYTIRLANLKDVPNIKEFINNHWKENHILVIDSQLFEYEYIQGQKVNFILAIRKDNDAIEGIFGFLPCSNSKDKKDVWGSLWKTTEEALPFLGVELAKRACDLIGCRMHIGNGANPKTTIPLRKVFFKEYVGRMSHYYFLNEDIKDYRIAKIIQPSYRKKDYEKKLNIITLTSMNEFREHFKIDTINAYPKKDEWYVEKRFYEHPYYKYKVYGVQKENQVKLVIVMREIAIKNRKVLRIVDCIGDYSLIADLQFFFEDKVKDYEYIDWYVYGVDETYFKQAGFYLRHLDDENIIPNYFEPFTQSNVDIWVHHKNPETIFFKADGDQDRPNTVKERKDTNV